MVMNGCVGRTTRVMNISGAAWKPLCPRTRHVASSTTSGASGSSQEDEASCPLVDAVAQRGAKNWESPFYVPGHKKGQAATKNHRRVLGDGALRHDTTELLGLDNLQHPEGVILEAMKKASEFWGSEYTWFLVNGATVGIQAAIMATCSEDDCLILARNAHQSAINGAILAGCRVVYARTEYSYGIAHHVTPEALEEAFQKAKTSGCCPRAALIVSPTYFGVQSDVFNLRRVCDAHGAILIVDEAHGAHLTCLPTCKDALDQGAHLVIQSTHKQLSSLTQSSMLHAQHISQHMKERLDQILNMLQSSSPSYLLLASLDAARAQAEDPAAIQEPHAAATHIHEYFNDHHGPSKHGAIALLSNLIQAPMFDPWRITLVLQTGLTGWSVATLLERERGVVAEMATHTTVVYACGIGTRREDAIALTDALDWLAKGNHLQQQEQEEEYDTDAASLIELSCQQAPTVPRDVFLSDRMSRPLEQCVSCTAAETITVYPPGIPILVPGDIITADHVRYIRKLSQSASSSSLIGGSRDAIRIVTA